MPPLQHTSFEESVADLIYEAAFDPDRWEDVLDGMAALAGADCGAVTVFRDAGPVGWRATGLCGETESVGFHLEESAFEPAITYFLANPVSGFVPHASYFPRETLCGPLLEKFDELGIAEQVGMMVPLGQQEVAIFCAHRKTVDGPFSRAQIATLNSYQSHLSRAALVSARLGLERARAATATLNALGVPAAVLSRSGRVRAANALLDDVSEIVTPLAFGGMALLHAPANKLFQEAVERTTGDHEAVVRSIPVPAPDGAPFVVHLLPLRRSAHDIFAGADALVAVTRVGAAKCAPAPTVLMGLFDLTPAEVRLARALAKGRSLRKAAEECGIRHSTARAYLDQIFRKTGTHRQGELVALLNSARPLV